MNMNKPKLKIVLKPKKIHKKTKGSKYAKM